VYGFAPIASPSVHGGSWAELVVVPEETSVALKPAGVDVAAAGAAPVAALTALAALDALELGEGSSVLVIGASGGVGSLFVQLAAAAGASVVAPGLPEDHAFLSGLGVSIVIDRDADLAGAARAAFPDGVDAILELVSREPDASPLAPGGRLASPLGAAGDGPGRFNLMASPTTPNLERLARLLADGTLRVPLQRSYPLEEAAQALADLAGRHTQGKLAIAIT
jgi:NADPH:quinone reductase-like Zn-dependent oxidoreductase